MQERRQPGGARPLVSTGGCEEGQRHSDGTEAVDERRRQEEEDEEQRRVG